MAIHPIDMSTIYAQMDNVAKYSASQNQLSQTASIIANTQGANETVQKSQEVQQVAEDGTEIATKVNPDGKNNEEGQGESEKGRKNRSSQEEEPAPRQWEIKDPRVGNLIDIAR